MARQRGGLTGLPDCRRIGIDRIVGATWHAETISAEKSVLKNFGTEEISAEEICAEESSGNRTEGQALRMKTVMGWIDKIVSSLARRKVNKDEGRPNSR